MPIRWEAGLEPPQPLTEPNFTSAAALLADAFFDNPAHVYQFPHEVAPETAPSVVPTAQL